MFASGMRDALEAKIPTEFSSPVLAAVLSFIYDARVPEFFDFAEQGCELLMAANLYTLSGLQVICEEHLCDLVDADNADDILALAADAGAWRLRCKALHEQQLQMIS